MVLGLARMVRRWICRPVVLKCPRNGLEYQRSSGWHRHARKRDGMSNVYHYARRGELLSGGNLWYL